MPGQGTQLRLSLLCWKERRSHSEHGANPVEEDEPVGQGAGVKIKQITVTRTVIPLPFCISGLCFGGKR